MNPNDFEQQIIGLSNYKRLQFVLSLSDDNIKFSLLKYLDSNDYKEKVINTFSSEELKLEGIKLLKDDNAIVRIASTFQDINLVREALNYISNEPNKVVLINKLSNESDRLSLASYVNAEWYKIEIVKTLTDDELKTKALALITRDDFKVRIINMISDENTRYELLSEINDEYEKAKVVATLKEELKIRALEFLSIESLRFEVIKEVLDENTRLALLKYLASDDYKEKVINTFSSEKLKLEGIKLLKNDHAIVRIASTFQDINLVREALNYISNEPNKVVLINKLSNESDRLSLASYVNAEWYKIEIVKTLTDDELKTKALALITRDDFKVRIINMISDENTRYELLSEINDEYEKAKVVATLKEELKIRALEFLSIESLRFEVIKEVLDENTRLALLKYLASDDYKEKVINTFSSEKLKLEGIKLLKDDHAIVRIASTFQDINLVREALNYIKEDVNKVRLVNKLSNESDRLSLASYVNVEWYRIEIVKTLTDDNLKKNAVSLFIREDFKSLIIIMISDENTRYELLDLITDDGEKEKIISSFTNDELLYNSIIMLKSDYKRATIVMLITNDKYKYNALSLIESEELKAKIINTMSDTILIVNAIKLLKNDNAKLKVINNIPNELIRISLLSTLEKTESKLIAISQIKSNEIKLSGLKTIDNYQEVMQDLFKKGLFEYLYHFEDSLLREIFDDKQIRILNEYRNINNIKIRKLFSNYVTKNYENINMDNLDKISQVLFRIDTSNSSELQAFGDLVANQVLSHEDPLQFFSQIEDIFVKNNIPYVGKIFEVFKLLHSNIKDYKNFSPLLNRFKDSKYQVQIMDLIIFNDLLYCAFGSNNRSLKEFIFDIEKGNDIFCRVVNQKDALASLSDSERNILIKYLDRIEIVLDSYDKWKNRKVSSKTNEELSLRIDIIIERLKLDGNSYKEIPDIIMKKVCGVSGIETFEKAKEYFKYIVLNTDKRNREKSEEPFTLEEGDFVKGIGDIKYLSRIFQNGSVSKEFLGDSSNRDSTPLDTDLSRILFKDIDGKNPNELGRIISTTISNSYGSTWFVLKNDPNRIEVTRDSNGIENSHNLSPKFSKLEAFKTLNDGHYGIRTGFPTSEISYIVSRSHFDRIGLEIAMNGFYIPVVNTEGKLVFAPKDYDELRSKMSGLSYYDETNYNFSKNLVSEDIISIAENIEQNNIETKRKRDLINSKIRECLEELGLTFKDKIDGDLSDGFVELIDTGSTGRGTNKPGDGDFDFMMRLDKGLLLNPSRLAELKKSILRKFDAEKTAVITDAGDFRIKNVKIDAETSVDIDISFTGKTDKVSYSTDMCLKERLSNIYNQDKERYKYVIANILLAKQVLKQGEVYKPNRGDNPQGGLGGVGIENWILQNGGSFDEAVRSFLEAAEGKTFEEFKSTYYIWDFGENHMAESRGKYAHDNFVNNMSESGYIKMVQVLNEYSKKYNYNQIEEITRL